MADANPTRRARTNSSPARVTGHVKLRNGKRGSTWYLRYRLPSGKHVQKRLGPAWTEKGRCPFGYFTKRGAEDALRAELTDVERGAIADPGAATGRTFADAVAAWLFYVEHEKGRRPSTLRGYGQVGGLLEEEFGAETPLEMISTEVIDAYRVRLLTEQKISRRTAQQRLVLLHGILHRAVRKGWLPANPGDMVERVNVPRKTEYNFLTVEQAEDVAAKAEGQFGAAILVAFYTGLRTGELRALRWRDVDFPGSTIRVAKNIPIGGEEGAPKSGKNRSVPLGDDAARALDGLSRRDHFTGDEDRVFPNEVGAPLGDDALRDGLYDAMETAGIDRLSFPAGPFKFHNLRDSYGTLAAKLGFSSNDIKNWMGHAHLETTERYMGYSPRHDAARRFTEGVEAERAVSLRAKNAVST